MTTLLFHHLLRFLRVCWLSMFFALFSSTVHSQIQPDADSLDIEQRIQTAFPDRPFVESARAILYNYLGTGAALRARTLVRFMDRRQDLATTTSWIGPSERLLTSLLVTDTALVHDRNRLADMLAGTVDPDRRSIFKDQLLDKLRSLMQRSIDRVVAGYDTFEPQPQERRFLELLINHLIVLGYRGRSELNAKVVRYEADYPGTWRAELARIYIVRPYNESEFGAAFSAGYSAGIFDGELGEHFPSLHGPVLGGEVYIYGATLSGLLAFGVAAADREFSAAGESWLAGSSNWTNLSLAAGYELRFERLGITPLAGLALQSARGAGDETGDAGSLPRTGYRNGLDLGIILGWRIPFDVGPSIDLRFRIDRISTALADYDPKFTGALYIVQLGFALVQRPYRAAIW
jgi:hypothetical protein